jgi:hypothetical protein
MEPTPMPVDLNNPALMALLSKSKNVMKKVEATAPIVLSEATQRQTAAEAMLEPETSAPMQPRAAAGYTREQVLASKMPQNIKEAMLKSIPVMEASPVYTLDDLEDDNVVMTPNKRRPITKQAVNESRVQSNSDLITISRGELKEMINDSLVKFLTESYNKTLTEAAIKKTIQTLINEGKLSVKKKI